MQNKYEITMKRVKYIQNEPEENKVSFLIFEYFDIFLI